MRSIRLNVQKRKNKKALSSIMGTVIVLAITLALGALLYSYAHGLFSNLTQNVNIVPQYSLVVNPDSNQAYLEVTIQNNGNIQVQLTSLAIYQASTQIYSDSSFSVTLQPGQTYQTVLVISAQITAGQYYTIVLSGKLPNGNPFTSVQNVLASISS